MALKTALPKPDVGGTMKKSSRVLFVIFLVIVLSASVVFSFNSLSRSTYEFNYTDNYNGTGDSGYVYHGYNGNADITEIYINHPMEKVGGEWKETAGDIIAIESYTFNADEYLQYIHIGPTVKYIESQAFVYCKSLRAFDVDENNPNYCSVDGVLYNKDMTEIIAYPICRCTQIVIDDVKNQGEVTNIGRENVESFSVEGKYVAGDENASTIFTALKDYIKTNYSGDFDYFNEFKEISQLLDEGVYAPYIGTYYQIVDNTDTGITIERFWTCDEKYEIPEGVTKVAGKAFYKCDRLTEITLPSTLKEIGDMAFFNCWQCSLIALPDGLETIGNDTFSYCSGMKYAVYIPASVTHIGHHCFYKCIEDIVFYMGADDDSQIELGGKWQPRNDNAFKAKTAPIWGSQRSDCDKYNEEKYAEDAKAAAEAGEDNSGDDSGTASNGMSKTAMIIMILCFIPGFAYIGTQIIRNVFKEDFLMTAKGKEKLQARKEENERIRQAYLNDQKDILEEAEDTTEETNEGSDE